MGLKSIFNSMTPSNVRFTSNLHLRNIKLPERTGAICSPGRCSAIGLLYLVNMQVSEASSFLEYFVFPFLLLKVKCGSGVIDLLMARVRKQYHYSQGVE